MFNEIQTWARGISGTAGQLNEDLHAAFNVLGVAAGQVGERAIAYTGAPTASAAWQLLRAMGNSVGQMFIAANSNYFDVPFLTAQAMSNRSGCGIVAWIKRVGPGTTRQVIYSESSSTVGGGVQEFWLAINDGADGALSMSSTNSTPVTITLQSSAGAVPLDGQYHCVMYIRDPLVTNKNTLLVDGVVVASNTTSFNPFFANLNQAAIGAYYAGGSSKVASNFFNGNIKDVCVYGNEVTQARAAQIAAKTLHPLLGHGGVMTQVRGYWTLTRGWKGDGAWPSRGQLVWNGTGAEPTGVPGPDGQDSTASADVVDMSHSLLYVEGPTVTVVENGGVGSQDRLIREIGPIVYNPADVGKEYKFYYSASPDPYNNTNTSAWMAYASSPSGPWTKWPTAVIPLATLGTEDVYVVFDSGTYHFWAENKTGGTNAFGICYFTSADGINWTRQDSNASPALDKTPAAWDSQDVSSPVVWKEGSTWFMIYEGRGAISTGRFGLATASSPAGPWTKDAANPIYGGNASTWENNDCVPDDIVKIGSSYYLIFHATGAGGPTGVGVGIVTSTSLTTGWTRAALNQLFGGSWNFEGMFANASATGLADRVLAVDGYISAGGNGNVKMFKLGATS